MIFVGSLKYSPIYKMHCCAFGKSCEKAGYDIRYIFSNNYRWMLPNDILKKTFFIGNSYDIKNMLFDSIYFNNYRKINDLINQYKPTHVYIHNYHFLNHYIAYVLKQNNGKLICHIHEPYVENKSLHGGIQQYWLYLNEYLEKKLLENTDIAIVSSKEALRLFNLHITNFKGKLFQVPLIYENLIKTTNGFGDCKYITFIGPPVPAKGPDIFLKIIKLAFSKDLSLKFLLISREKITDEKFNCSNLDIYYKNRISDKELGSLLNKSLVTLTPYKRETQSSVVLVSFMYGVPIVSSNVGGLMESIKHRKNGYIVKLTSPTDEWIEGIKYCIEHFEEISLYNRLSFLNNNSEENWGKYLQLLLS